ncbi:MAG: hypothetical protein IJ189_12880, partial [Clostridia bacterium]|nr:hypothetical protein [Clostridia bacterium]
YDRLLEFWCVPLVWLPLWHDKSPHLLVVYHTCLTNGVQFKPLFSGVIVVFAVPEKPAAS